MAVTDWINLPTKRNGGIVQPEHVIEIQDAVNVIEGAITGGSDDVDLLSASTKFIYASTAKQVGITWSTQGLTLYGQRQPTSAVSGTTLAPTFAQSGYQFHLARAAGTAITLPDLLNASNNDPYFYDFFFRVSVSGGSTTITCGGSDLFYGNLFAIDTDSSNALVADGPNQSSHHIATFNGSTQGGLIGTHLRATSVIGGAVQGWLLEGYNRHSGNFATIFS